MIYTIFYIQFLYIYISKILLLLLYNSEGNQIENIPWAPGPGGGIKNTLGAPGVIKNTPGAPGVMKTYPWKTSKPYKT